MAKLNKKNKKTEKIIHLLITSLCNRNCEFCCNKQYDLNKIPYVTDEELKNAETLLLTGGEPFLFSNPCEIATHYKLKYKNIKNIYVYTNALELLRYLNLNKFLNGIDGLSVSIKNELDLWAFNKLVKNPKINKLTSNRVYIFDNLIPEELGNFKLIIREFQKDFQPAIDSIFRKI